MKKAKATIDFEVWNLDCPNCGADHKLDRKEVESEFLYCSECGEAFEPVMSGLEAELLEALKIAEQWFSDFAFDKEPYKERPAADLYTIMQEAINKAEGV